VTASVRGAGRRVRRLWLVIDRPGDAWLLVRMAAWAAVLPVLKHVMRLDTLARLMWRDRSRTGRVDREKVLAFSRLLARPVAPGEGTCYERGLLVYRFLSQRGADPRLVVGVKNVDDAVTGHAWVMVDGTAVGESETVDEFVPVVAYGRDGRREAVSAPL
jgi:transglutaminase superfamily protein